MKFFLTLLLLIYTSNAFAEDKELDDVVQENVEEKKVEESISSTYSPDFCDFEITFPEEPYNAKRCPQGSAKCYSITNYTMVYNLNTTVDVSATCVPSPPSNYGRYNDRVIQTVLNSMTEKAEISNASINVVDKGDYRIGTLIGTGTYGKQSRIYNAQIWVGQNSVMTIEAKLVGSTHHEADAVFAEILKSLKKKQAAEPVQP